ncbi:VOC family protein [Parasphingorhabdus sp.]|uniref:VOC family protein n=1 Tax=Parasphingorhabdus sp. TaxID=2709688 RepID=UPI003A900469
MTEKHTDYEIHPPRQRWTHLALIVKDIEKTIAWYEKYTHLEVLSRNEDGQGYGAWMADREDAESPFVLVLAQFFEGMDPFAPAEHGTLGPFAHIGIEVMAREDVDRLAAMGKEDGCLALGPTQMPAPVGYICFLKDPDGNTVEFSYDQGVYETARKVWSSDAT